jgi:hypothetical protein
MIMGTLDRETIAFSGFTRVNNCMIFRNDILASPDILGHAYSLAQAEYHLVFSKRKGLSCCLGMRSLMRGPKERHHTEKIASSLGPSPLTPADEKKKQKTKEGNLKLGNTSRVSPEVQQTQRRPRCHNGMIVSTGAGNAITPKIAISRYHP